MKVACTVLKGLGVGNDLRLLSRAICTSPQIPLREKLFFRITYETTFRPFEAQHLRIEDWNRATREINARRVKVKYNPRTKAKISLPRSMKLTENTNEMLRAFVGNRRKAIFSRERKVSHLLYGSLRKNLIDMQVF